MLSEPVSPSLLAMRPSGDIPGMRLTGSAISEEHAEEDKPVLLLEEEEEEQLPLRKRLQLFLNTTAIGKYVSYADIFVSTAALGLYVAETNTAGRPNGLVIAEVAIVSFFAALFLLHIFLSTHRLKFLLSLQSLLDVLSIIPITTISITSEPAFGIKCVRLLRLTRMSHFHQVGAAVLFCAAPRGARPLTTAGVVCRVGSWCVFVLYRVFPFNPSQVVAWGETEIKKQLISMSFTILAITLSAAAVIELLENYDRLVPGDGDVDLNFFEAYYLVVMSITTVGCVVVGSLFHTQTHTHAHIHTHTHTRRQTDRHTHTHTHTHMAVPHPRCRRLLALLAAGTATSAPSRGRGGSQSCS